MGQERNQQEPTIKVDGQSYSLNESQTGRFGVTKAELQGMIVSILSHTRKGSKAARPLFKSLLQHMGIITRGKPAEELYKIFFANLRELKDRGRIMLVSGKTRLYVRLT